MIDYDSSGNPPEFKSGDRVFVAPLNMEATVIEQMLHWDYPESFWGNVKLVYDDGIIGTSNCWQLKKIEMTNEEIAIRQHLSKPRPLEHPCGCLGPQGNDPVCPCAMAWVEQVGQRLYRISENRTPNGVNFTATIIKNKD